MSHSGTILADIIYSRMQAAPGWVGESRGVSPQDFAGDVATIHALPRLHAASAYDGSRSTARDNAQRLICPLSKAIFEIIVIYVFVVSVRNKQNGLCSR